MCLFCNFLLAMLLFHQTQNVWENSIQLQDLVCLVEAVFDIKVILPNLYCLISYLIRKLPSKTIPTKHSTTTIQTNNNHPNNTSLFVNKNANLCYCHYIIVNAEGTPGKKIIITFVRYTRENGIGNNRKNNIWQLYRWISNNFRRFNLDMIRKNKEVCLRKEMHFIILNVRLTGFFLSIYTSQIKFRNGGYKKRPLNVK